MCVCVLIFSKNIKVLSSTKLLVESLIVLHGQLSLTTGAVFTFGTVFDYVNTLWLLHAHFIYDFSDYKRQFRKTD